MFQRFIAVGRLGRDPEVAATPSGIKYANLSLATSDYVKGEERTEWHRVVVWDEKLIEVIQKRACKGTLLAIEGQIRTRKWMKDGREVVATEVVLDRFGGRLQILANGRVRGEEREEERPSAPAGSGRGYLAHARAVEFEDELPF